MPSAVLRAAQGCMLCLLCAVNALLCHAQDVRSVQVRTEHIAGGIYLLSGGGGNIGASVGEDGILIVDDQYAELSAGISSALSAISNKPIRFVVNTHWHRDHTGGNEHFAAAGALVIAHEQVRERLRTEQFIELFQSSVPPAPPAALPVITFRQDLTVHFNGEEIHIMHPGPAHTDGDAVVFFRTANVLHAGDLYFEGMYPYIGISSGGSVDALIGTIDRLLQLIDADTKIIPGHGPLANREKFSAYRDMLAALRDRISLLLSEGKTLEEVVAAKPSRDFDAQWGQGFIQPDTFVAIIAKSLGLRQSR